MYFILKFIYFLHFVNPQIYKNHCSVFKLTPTFLSDFDVSLSKGKNESEYTV